MQTLASIPAKPIAPTAEPDEQTALSELYERLLEEQQKHTQAQVDLQAKQTEIETLKSKLRLLTDGKDPEVKKREEAEQQKQAEVKKKKRKELLAQLQRLEGKWFAGAERTKLFEKLQALENE